MIILTILARQLEPRFAHVIISLRLSCFYLFPLFEGWSVCFYVALVRSFNGARPRTMIDMLGACRALAEVRAGHCTIVRFCTGGGGAVGRRATWVQGSQVALLPTAPQGGPQASSAAKRTGTGLRENRPLDHTVALAPRR